mmetsp:Transcript_21820/g.88873  ORF Transcript_21820/g.88873 Transcript_21820/m.88873 type:complete len:91 (+) Transcript_21820:1778-2050(+)
MNGLSMREDNLAEKSCVTAYPSMNRIQMRISDDTGLYLFVHRIPDIKDPLSRKALSNVPIKGDADFAEYLKANGLRESDVKMYYFPFPRP